MSYELTGFLKIWRIESLIQRIQSAIASNLFGELKASFREFFKTSNKLIYNAINNNNQWTWKIK
jgi:hypothetical protein